MREPQAARRNATAAAFLQRSIGIKPLRRGAGFDVPSRAFGSHPFQRACRHLLQRALGDLLQRAYGDHLQSAYGNLLPRAYGNLLQRAYGNLLQRACGNLLQRACGATLNLLLPPHCPGCDTQVHAQGSFCHACFAGLQFITAPCCHGCGLPFASAAQAGFSQRCPACIERPPPWREARAALLYTDAAARLITGFKHAGREEIAAILAPHLARAGKDLLARADLLVPVPLHPTRLRQRGFNQSARLAQALARATGRPAMVDALRRMRPTASLGRLGATARAAELTDAIILRDSRAPAIYGRQILLIDDVLTSGATAGACARALLGAGAAAVDVLVAARVADPQTR